MRVSDRQIERVIRELAPILRDQVVVRFGVKRDGHGFIFESHLATICSHDGIDYLVEMSIPVETLHYVRSNLRFEVHNLSVVPSAIPDMVDQWSCRRFDDWMYGKPFMGAIDIYRDGMPHTSVKQEPDSPRWQFLIGVLVGVVGQFSTTMSDGTNRDPVCIIGAQLLHERFAAFAAQNVREQLGEQLASC